MKFRRSKAWSAQRKKLKPKKCGSISPSVYMCDVYSLRLEALSVGREGNSLSVDK